MATSSSEHLDETSATHHHLVASRRSTNGTSGEDVDESSLTRHETRHDASGDDFAELKIGDDGDDQQKLQKSANAILNERVAAYATRAYKKAVANSKILKKDTDDDDGNDVAMVKFHELKVGKFLGNGSFSDVQ